MVTPPENVTGPNSIAPMPAEQRGIQYFAAHLEEARQVVAQCAEGSANAEQAVIEAEGGDRFKRFMGN